MYIKTYDLRLKMMCFGLRIMEHIADFQEKKYPWCFTKNDCPDIEIERDCDKYECMTNADKIRNMTDEELAEFLCLYDACVTCSHDGKTCNSMNCDEIGVTERWLQKEVE